MPGSRYERSSQKSLLAAFLYSGELKLTGNPATQHNAHKNKKPCKASTCRVSFHLPVVPPGIEPGTHGFFATTVPNFTNLRTMVN
jgi:hypothetical protein